MLFLWEPGNDWWFSSWILFVHFSWLWLDFYSFGFQVGIAMFRTGWKGRRWPINRAGSRPISTHYLCLYLFVIPIYCSTSLFFRDLNFFLLNLRYPECGGCYDSQTSYWPTVNLRCMKMLKMTFYFYAVVFELMNCVENVDTTWYQLRICRCMKLSAAETSRRSSRM